MTHLILNRPLTAERFTDSHRRHLRFLWPHLQRAVQTRALLARVRGVATAAAGSLNALPLPAWVVTVDAIVEFANASAQAIEPKLWRADHRRRLHRLGDLDAPEIRQLVSHDRLGRAAPVAIADGDRLARATLRTAPVDQVDLYVDAWPRAHALLLLEVPVPVVDVQWHQRLAAHFGLTPTESRVLELLKAGHSVEQIAVLQHVNASTVRTHLRALFLKTGRSRQSGLVRLALGD